MMTIPCDYCGEQKQVEHTTDTPTVVELTGEASDICDGRGFIIYAATLQLRNNTQEQNRQVSEEST
jgi:sarcosine oxidase delta subunit